MYVHRLGIIHKDIKPENIFLDADGICKIGDFGASVVLPDAAPLVDSAYLTNDCGTYSYSYAALELIVPKTRDRVGRPMWLFGQGVDFWALGMVTYELATGAVLEWRESAEGPATCWTRTTSHIGCWLVYYLP